MSFHRTFGDAERGRDLLVGHTLGDSDGTETVAGSVPLDLAPPVLVP